MTEFFSETYSYIEENIFQVWKIYVYIQKLTYCVENFAFCHIELIGLRTFSILNGKLDFFQYLPKILADEMFLIFAFNKAE